jgi:hypothetical protein
LEFSKLFLTVGLRTSIVLLDGERHEVSQVVNLASERIPRAMEFL